MQNLLEARKQQEEEEEEEDREEGVKRLKRGEEIVPMEVVDDPTAQEILNNPFAKLNDNVVNLYGEHLQSIVFKQQGVDILPRTEGVEKRYYPKVDLIFSTFLYEKLLKDDTFYKDALKYTKPLYQSIDLFSCRSLVFPINIGNLHWVCVVVKGGVMVYFDSYCTKPESEVGLGVMKRVEEFLNSQNPASFVAYDKRVYPHSNPQRDGYSCGLYVCYRMQSVVNDTLDTEIQDIEGYRKYLAQVII